MKITFLGVGSAFSKKNASSNLLVESGDIRLLVDCGHSAPASIAEYGEWDKTLLLTGRNIGVVFLHVKGYFASKNRDC